jgi:hypothetical protein
MVQVKDARLISLTREYKLFKMKLNESIREMHTRFIIFISELVRLEKNHQ